jgi:hypothetical protein
MYGDSRGAYARCAGVAGRVMPMTVGPWDDAAPLGPSEYGGKAGLVQSKADGHDPTPAERLAMANRTDGGDPAAIDPVTGIAQPVE